MSSDEGRPTTGPASGRFHTRPHLSAALLTRLISRVLARLLSALDEGDLEDGDFVALALAVDQTAFTAQVTAGGTRRKSRRSEPLAAQRHDGPRRPSDRPRPESSLVDSNQVSWQRLCINVTHFRLYN